MASWADVEFRETTKRRRGYDLLPLAPDILMIWDFLAVLGSGEAAQALWHAHFQRIGRATGAATFMPEIVMGGLAVALVLRWAAGMTRDMSASLPHSICSARRCYSCVIAAFVALAIVGQIGHSSAQLWILVWFSIFAPIIGVTRWGVERYFARLEEDGAFRETVAIVGSCGARERLAVRIASTANVVGFCETPLDQTGFFRQDEIEKLHDLGAEGCLDSVVLAFDSDHAETDISLLIDRLRMLPTEVAICTEDDVPGPDTKTFRLLGDVPIRVVADRPINRRDLLIKTMIDKTVAVILLACLLPVMAGIAAVIATTSRGPVIFRQTRQGWCGRQFTVFKFRTMHHVMQTVSKYRQTRRKDPRCTGFGKMLRRISLDELPQLWNVVRGDMSLVGPRPHADMLDEADRAGREIIAEYAKRFRVKPGITGWAQIHGARGPTLTVEQLQQRVDFDLYYIENWSLWLDFQILARTPLCLMGKNVF